MKQLFALLVFALLIFFSLLVEAKNNKSYLVKDDKCENSEVVVACEKSTKSSFKLISKEKAMLELGITLIDSYNPGFRDGFTMWIEKELERWTTLSGRLELTSEVVKNKTGLAKVNLNLKTTLSDRELSTRVRVVKWNLRSKTNFKKSELLFDVSRMFFGGELSFKAALIQSLRFSRDPNYTTFLEFNKSF